MQHKRQFKINLKTKERHTKMVDFAKYKANRDSNKEKVTELLKTQTTQKTQSYDNDDVRFWKPTMDSVKKVGGAVIRFLPDGNEENLLSYVKYFEHSFKNPENGKWYIERSLSSLPELGQDSIAALNKKLWSSSSDKDHPHKKVASRQKRNTKFISNILVVNDPANPENNGKVFLYKFGPAIYNKIEASQFPKEDAITGAKPDALDAFDIIDGANFEIRINDTKDGWDYSDSRFSTPTPLAKSDAVFDAVLKQLHNLSEFIDIKNYKSNSALDKRLIEVLGTHYQGFEVVEGFVGVSNPSNTHQNEQLDTPNQKQAENIDLPFAPDPATSTTSFASSSDEDFFNKLMEES